MHKLAELAEFNMNSIGTPCHDLIRNCQIANHVKVITNETSEGACHEKLIFVSSSVTHYILISAYFALLISQLGNADAICSKGMSIILVGGAM